MSGHSLRKPQLSNIQAFRALRHRNFRWLWVSGIGQTTAQGMQQLTLAWLVLELSGSASQLGAVIFIQGLPMMIFLTYGGVLADRIPRVKLLIGSHLVSMPILVVLGVLAALEQAQVWHVYVASFIIGAVQAVIFPARNAIVQDVVEREDLMNAVALNAMLQNLIQVVGPSLAGLMIAFLGIGATLYANASLYVISILGLLMLSSIKVMPATTRRSFTSDVVQGVRHVWNVPPVFAIISIGCIMGLLIHPASQLLPAFARDEIGVGAAGAGTLLMAAGIGSVLATTVLAALGDIPIKNWILLWAAILYGAALFVFAWTPSFALTFVLMLFVGGGRMAFVSIGTALIQLLVESGYAGRALSLWSLGVALMFVGALPLGLLGDEIGLRTAIAINAVLYLGATIVMGFVWPPIRSISRLRAEPVAGTPG